MKVTCPTDIGQPDGLIGCGEVFEAEPDAEGLVDCPHCGLFFEATQGTLEGRATALRAAQIAEQGILFMLSEKAPSTQVVLTIAISREQAKRNVKKRGVLSGNPDWWLVTPLTAPGTQVSWIGDGS